MTDISAIHQFLLCETPQSWIDDALANMDLLLIDHANCEKKAASSAITLMYRYVDHYELLHKMSRLAREELRHFEQVIAIMEARHIQYHHIEAASYAKRLRQPIRTAEPHRLIDTLIVSALIEARSCERFAKLAPVLDAPLQHFYQSLLKSEARHYEDYLQLAANIADDDIQDRVDMFLTLEQRIILEPSNVFRFHSGPLSQRGDAPETAPHHIATKPQ